MSLTQPDSIRPPALAGTFYEGTAAALAAQVDRCLSLRVPSEGRPPKAVIAPHAGLVYSGPVAASAYATWTDTAVERVVLLGPSHHFAFDGFVIPQAETWQTPLGAVNLDTMALAQLSNRPDVQVSDAAHQPEHSLEVHLPFLQRVVGDFALIPVLVGQITPAQGASLLRSVWGDNRTRIVISSDLSHFFSLPHARQVDAETTALVCALDFDGMISADACGRYPASALLYEASRRQMTVQAIDVRTSADTAGDPSRVVGYGSYLFWDDETADHTIAQRETLVALARESIADGLRRGADVDRNVRPMRLADAESPSWLQEKAATFVTLNTSTDQLRGCIGTLSAYQSLGQDIVDHAFAAAFRDPRFDPVNADEANFLGLHISVLGTPEPLAVRDEDDACRRLRPGVDGVILTSGVHRATFLPQVWESLPDPLSFLVALKHKAGLSPDHWPVDLQIYTVEDWHG
ncbi:MAG: AmmeMemoRadiSam system protein B [Myxococcales bacterium]|nr:AmmeMemoRadiSam system protein B [Myxococcales bacterium]